MRSIGDAPLVEQPGMDDLPLVTSTWSEIQKRRPPVLKLVKELQRVSGSVRWRIIRLSLKPTIPFLKNEGFPYVLSHGCASSTQEGEALESLGSPRWSFLKCRLYERTVGSASRRRLATAAPMSTFKDQYAQEGLTVSKYAPSRVARRRWQHVCEPPR